METSTEPEVETNPQDTISTGEDVGGGADGEESQEGQEDPEAVDTTQQTGEPSEEEITETTNTVGQSFIYVCCQWCYNKLVDFVVLWLITSVLCVIESSVDKATHTPSASPKAKKRAGARDTDEVKMKVVKFNLTTAITQLDLPDPTLVQTEVSTQK